jgi:uncharacterized protein YkwD
MNPLSLARRASTGALVTVALSGCGGGAAPTPSSGFAAPAPSPQSSSAALSASGALSFTIVDYFTARAIGTAGAAVDGSAIPAAQGSFGFTPQPGLHLLSITAPGYASYNGAIQVPSGSTQRTISLFPISAPVQAWLQGVNADRAANGAGPVALDDMLTIAAFDHAADMAERGYFAHFDPHGFAPTTRALLLGGMLAGWENIAAGYASWQSAEEAFVAERSSLPSRRASDCASFWDSAGHYCNIVDSTHNWVGLGIVDRLGSRFGAYYDQEFGDLYGYFDATVTGPEPALGTSASQAMSVVSGTALSGYFMNTMPAPVAISIATLNADPRCVSECPRTDQWWPANGPNVGSSPFALALDVDQIYWPSVRAQIPAVVWGAQAAIWAGGNVLPDRYGDPSLLGVQAMLRKPRSLEPPALVPNGAEMRVLRPEP